MNILEVRDDFVKFRYETDIYLSSFIKIDSVDKSYIAQIIRIKKSEKIGFAKILFLYNDKLAEYDKTSPSEDSVISDFTSEILSGTFNAVNPILAGKTVDDKNNILIDTSCLDKKTLICSDSEEADNIIIKNLAKQFNNINKNVVIIDTQGTIKANKYTASVDFKLPLNKSSLIFMYEECLNDVTSESKSTIVEIFRDLAEYAESVPFVPFNALKTIVDNMVDKSHMFKLLVLKSKLAKFDRFGYFAKDTKEVDKINTILNSKCAVIDVSKLDSAFQNKYIQYIYDVLADKNSAVILKLSNLTSKKTLKMMFDSKLISVPAANSGFKYIKDIKNMFDNFFIYPSERICRLFEIYSAFLRAMDKDNYLIVGEGTNYIPLISVLKQLYEKAPASDIQILDEIIKKEKANQEITAQEYEHTPEEAQNEIIANINEKSDATIANLTQNIEAPTEIDMFSEEDSEEDIEETSEEEQEEITVQQNEQPENIDDEAIILPSEDINEEDSVEEELVSSEEIPVEDLIQETEDIDLQDSLNDIQTEEIPDENIQEEILSDIDNQKEDEEQENIILTDDSDLSDENEEVVLPAEESLSEETQTTEDNTEDFSDDTELNEIISDDIIELNPDETDDNDIIIDIDDDLSADVEEEIKQDVDKVYTTIKEDDFTDSDLDLIDEINNDAESEELTLDDNNDTLLEEISDEDNEENSGIIEEYNAEDTSENNTEEIAESPEILETKDSTTPIVPVYEAAIPEEDIVESDSIQQGDLVTHVRFGNGVVEKLVKYGNKNLYMINFDSNGRRLLDPLLTEIKKI